MGEKKLPKKQGVYRKTKKLKKNVLKKYAKTDGMSFQDLVFQKNKKAKNLGKSYDKYIEYVDKNFSKAEIHKALENNVPLSNNYISLLFGGDKNEKIYRQREVKRKKIIAYVLSIVVSAAITFGLCVLAKWLKGQL